MALVRRGMLFLYRKNGVTIFMIAPSLRFLRKHFLSKYIVQLVSDPERLHQYLAFYEFKNLLSLNSVYRITQNKWFVKETTHIFYFFILSLCCIIYKQSSNALSDIYYVQQKKQLLIIFSIKTKI